MTKKTHQIYWKYRDRRDGTEEHSEGIPMTSAVATARAKNFNVRHPDRRYYTKPIRRE